MRRRHTVILIFSDAQFLKYVVVENRTDAIAEARRLAGRPGGPAPRHCYVFPGWQELILTTDAINEPTRAPLRETAPVLKTRKEERRSAILRAMAAGAVWLSEGLCHDDAERGYPLWCWWLRGSELACPILTMAYRLKFVKEGLIRPEPTQRHPARCVITEEGRRIVEESRRK